MPDDLDQQDYDDTSAFAFNGLASLAKAVAFLSLAKEALKANERISATVCAYYSLLHLAITLIYLCPDKISPPLRNELRTKRGQGEVDPSNSIKHSAACEFVKTCSKDGLDARFHSQLQVAKKLREFVNYGPRLTIRNNTAYFGPCTARPTDCDGLISVISDLFSSAMEWAYTHSELKGTFVLIAVEKCGDFFVKPDLFYTQWCSKECIEDSRAFIKRLDQKMRTLRT